MNVLALSPHTDDIELCAGGTVARFVEEGARVHVAAFGTGDSGGGAYPREFRAAMEVLGVEAHTLLDYTSRFYYTRRQDILGELEQLRSEMQPDLVLIPALGDSHQDHRTITAEALRVFKHASSIWAYELPTNQIGRIFAPIGYVCLNQRHVEQKLAALACYKSQWEQPHRTYMRGGYAKALLVARGGQIKVDYAEAFEVIREINRLEDKL